MAKQKKKSVHLHMNLGTLIFLIIVIYLMAYILSYLGKSKLAIYEAVSYTHLGSTAKDRLKLVLVSDRANCSPETMELLKNDIIKVISKYMEIDTEGLDIQITQTESDGGHGNVPAIYANIPIKELRSPR